jgi:hypothetical protein
MLTTFRRLLAALESIASRLERQLTEQSVLSTIDSRLLELELSRAKWEAEMDAYLLKAESTLKSSNNAESRARVMTRKYESLFDEVGEDRMEELEAGPQRDVPPIDAGASEEEGLQPLRLALETDPKAFATRMKWG